VKPVLPLQLAVMSLLMKQLHMRSLKEEDGKLLMLQHFSLWLKVRDSTFHIGFPGKLGLHVGFHGKLNRPCYMGVIVISSTLRKVVL